MIELSYVRVATGTVEEATARLENELRARGFGVLAHLAVHQILKEKINAVIPPVVILEVCSPRHAHVALETSREAALLLPCKITVSEEKGRTQIALQRPTTVLATLLPVPELRPLGEEVETLLRAAVDASA